MQFKDYFSTNSKGYSTYRPSYPHSLYSYLASLCTEKEIAWDCATGTGQAAIDLTEYFEHIIASDGSQSQIDNAQSHTQIKYLVCPAENSGITDDSIDLITVAQALHWFDLDAFAKEAHRVMKKEAVLAVWTYNLLSINEEIDKIIHHLYHDIVGDYWPFERRIVEQGYADITLPFSPIKIPESQAKSFTMKCEWNLSQLLGYLNTWSAVRQYEKQTGKNPVEIVFNDLHNSWQVPETKQVVNWPLAVRAWHNSM